MRKKIQPQTWIDYNPSSLKITNDYYAMYEAISGALDANPRILTLVHQDLQRALPKISRNRDLGRPCSYSSDTVLRIQICQAIEGESLRGIVVRIDDSNYLRRFIRIDGGKMMDYTTLCRLRNAIRPETWQQINHALTLGAIDAGEIKGEALRLDTTAVETNIHWPTDSSLLWDVYRVMARWMRTARKIDLEAAGDGRLQEAEVKRLSHWIARKAGKKKEGSEAVKTRYAALIGHIEHILAWAEDVAEQLSVGITGGFYTLDGMLEAQSLLVQWEYYEEVGERVVSQAQRRILKGEKVSVEEKIYSIFEPHTELLKRGKAQKPIEFGHMVLFQQVDGKYITDYQVYAKRPVEPETITPALKTHVDQFGAKPNILAADKGFYKDMATLRSLEKEIEIVSIAKKGKRTFEETEREHSLGFKLGQRFRAGIEGSISGLKRALGLSRCLRRGWNRFACAIGQAVFVHNLLILARGYG